MMNDEKALKYFKISCIAECISCVLLFLIAMPIKYTYGTIWQMIPIGIIHGACFTAYLIFAFRVKKLYNWDDEKFAFIIMFAFIPFATLWVGKDLPNSKE